MNLPISPLLFLLLAPLLAIVFILAKAPARPTAGIAAAFNLIFSLCLLVFYPSAAPGGGYAYVMDCTWAALQGLPPIHFHLGVDGISLPLVFLTGIVTLAAIAISPGNIRRSSEYYCYLLLMSLGAMGAFTSLDLLQRSVTADLFQGLSNIDDLSLCNIYFTICFQITFRASSHFFPPQLSWLVQSPGPNQHP